MDVEGIGCMYGGCDQEAVWITRLVMECDDHLDAMGRIVADLSNESEDA
jgi:hypothetical protein